jgi:4-hydroxy-tetrahydrodipicolinate synthase
LDQGDETVNIDEVKRTLRGPMIPVITNLNDDLSVDHAAIRENVQYVVERGIVTGRGVLLAVGAGGDFPMLTLEERKTAAQTIAEAAAGEAPVVVGAQDTKVDVCIELARWAEAIGACGIQVAPPYYYTPSDDDIIRVFEAVHDATERTVLMIYYTWWEGCTMSFELIERLGELPRCRSLKWSHPSGGGPYLRGVHRFAPSMAVVDNQGMAVMTHMLGGTGVITHLATVWPDHDLAVWTLLEAGDYAAAQKRITAVNWPWYDFRCKMGARTGGESPTVKAALELCGRPGGPSRLPSRALTDDERAELRDLLLRIGVPGVSPRAL